MKHLTDSECAAHYEQAQATLLAVKTIAAREGTTTLPAWDPYLSMAATWHRFANTAHAHQDTE